MVVLGNLHLSIHIYKYGLYLKSQDYDSTVRFNVPSKQIFSRRVTTPMNKLKYFGN